MNGVRRLLGGATGTSPPSPDKDSPLVQSTSTAPLSFVKNNQANWPPSSPSASPKQPTLSESFQSTAALFLGKKEKGRQQSEDEETLGNPYSSTRPLNGINTHTKSSSTSRNNQHSPSPSRSATRNGSVSVPSSPVLQTRGVSRKSVKVDSDIKRSSGFLNTRDELLVSLLASEAVVDCRDFTVLTLEEVEDLKKEQQVLNARLVAMKKKLGLETKIRDAAISLSRVNASHKKVSKQTEEQLEAANRRVDVAQKEVWSVSERANEVHRKLMEHRAGVLSYSVRSMEKKIAPVATSYDSGYDSNRSTMISPTSTSITGTSVGSSKPRFEGAHFFAGHAEAIVPKKQLSPEAAALEIASLESRLKAAADALTTTSKQQVELTRELSMARLEHQEAETMMSLELQTAEETILAMEKELPRLEGLDAEVQELLQEKEQWEGERANLEERSRQVDSLQARIADLETRSGEAAGAERLLAEVREQSRQELEQRDLEIQELREKREADRKEWERDRSDWERSRGAGVQQLKEEMEKIRSEDETALQQVNQELDEGMAALRQMIREHGIVLFSRESTLKALLEAVSSHLETVHSKLEGYKFVEIDWSAAKRKLEEDVRIGLDKRESMAKELEDARRERDLAKRETTTLKEKELAFSSPIIQPKSILLDTSANADSNVNKIMAILQPIWAVLPSPEARAAKFSAGSSRSYRTGSPAPSQPNISSLSDLDVRSLKALYGRDGIPNSPSSPTSAAGFSIEAFAQRVQALIADDKALIERLVRFAQAHDLLKKNAERAQRLAQEGNAAMETYQKQVRMLEERNMSLGTRISAMQDELQLLHDTIERLTEEKHEMEDLAAEQAETCRQLSEANDTLSARTLTLAEEAASAPEMVRKQLEPQITELKKKLESAEADIEEMKTTAQNQRAALFEEMNSMHEENSNLRAQLRAAKK